MGHLRSMIARSSGTALLMVTLGLTLALTAVLTYQAWDAGSAERATAEKALGDYASFSAFLFGLHAGNVLPGAAERHLASVARVVLAAPEGRPPSPAFLQSGAPNPTSCCLPLAEIRYWFRLDPADREVETTGPKMPPELAAWLAAAVAEASAPGKSPGWSTHATLTAAFGEPRFFGLKIRRTEGGVPDLVYGFEAGMEQSERVFRALLDEIPLLPPSLTGGRPNEALLAFQVVDHAGNEIFRSGEMAEEVPAGEHELTPLLGGVRVRAVLQPDVVETLLIGGLPSSRMPLLLGLLGLATILIGSALVQLRRERQLHRLREDFIANVSHELRTPLAQIRMFAETLRLRRVRCEAEHDHAVGVIDQESRRLGQLVENVLQFSRFRRGIVPLRPEPTELGTAVGCAVRTFAPLARARGVTLTMQLRSGITVPVDVGALRQVLLNLLDNAVKYGPEGQTVRVGLSRSGSGARVWVEDEGPGVPEAERDRIWRPFRRLARESGNGVAGSGIGLSVVRSLVEAHGGRAWVEEGGKGGARFVVEFPGVLNGGTPENGRAPFHTNGVSQNGSSVPRPGALDPLEVP